MSKAIYLCEVLSLIELGFGSPNANFNQKAIDSLKLIHNSIPKVETRTYALYTQTPL